MKRFVKFEIHEFMDKCPTEDIKMWEGVTENEIAKKCYEYTEYMNSVYSGGTTTFKGIMNKKEAQQWLFDEVINEIRHYHNEDTAENIQRMCELYNQAYNN